MVLKANEQDIDGLRRSGDIPKTRLCLRCGASFQSEWSGERICKPCKGTAGWRTGGLPHDGSTGRRR
jgi:hypothetical protein